MGAERTTPPSGREREDVRITRHEDYVEVEFSGAFSPTAAMGVVDLMVAACQETGCPRVLLDCRRMSGPLGVTDRYEVAEYGARVIGHHVTVALLARPDQVLPDRFFESVAVSRGVRVQTFIDATQALAWLGRSTPG